MSQLTDFLKILRDEIMALFVDKMLDVKTFFVSSAEYAAANITPEMLKIIADCVAAAEVPGQTGVEKNATAFSNIVAALEKDAIAFVVSDLKYGIEAVLQAKKAREAQAAAET